MYGDRVFVVVVMDTEDQLCCPTTQDQLLALHELPRQGDCAVVPSNLASNIHTLLRLEGVACETKYHLCMIVVIVFCCALVVRHSIEQESFV